MTNTKTRHQLDAEKLFSQWESEGMTDAEMYEKIARFRNCDLITWECRNFLMGMVFVWTNDIEIILLSEYALCPQCDKVLKGGYADANGEVVHRECYTR